MANFDSVFQRLCYKAVYIRHFGGTREFKTPNRSSLQCLTSPCDLSFSFGFLPLCLGRGGGRAQPWLVTGQGPAGGVSPRQCCTEDRAAGMPSCSDSRLLQEYCFILTAKGGNRSHTDQLSVVKWVLMARDVAQGTAPA